VGADETDCGSRAEKLKGDKALSSCAFQNAKHKNRRTAHRPRSETTSTKNAADPALPVGQRPL
jgi:hypothetical protein